MTSLLRTSLVALFVATASFSAAWADVKPHGLFTDNMVLQRGEKTAVWGTAETGEEVTVRLGEQEVKTTAADGKWRVALKNLQAGGPHTLAISGKNKVELKNVLVGDVWLCGGQSNMEWPVNASHEPERVKAEAKHPQIRLFTVPRRGAPQPETNVQGAWVECAPNTVGGFSAVGYAFGRDLHKHLNVPIGLLSSNVGGTAAEQWTSREVLENHPDLKVLAPRDISSKLYNAMIHPLAPFGIRGAIWYQGESNAGRAYQYRTLYPAMIKNWRDVFGQGEFPFLCVQLAPFTNIVPQPVESDWAELREAQLMTAQKFPNTAMAVITDVGDEKDIHPKKKEPVGARLALAARALAYGEKVEYTGPLYESLTVSGGKAIVRFKNTAGGLVAKGGELTGFTIAGKDRKFHNAQAAIDGDTVVVSCPDVAEPVAVRFGWANYPVVNLWNKADLPATPFRTDDFPGKTANNK